MTKSEVLHYSSQYVYDNDDALTARLQEAVQRGHMTRDDLVAVAAWKWRGGRTRQLAAENTEEEVNEITRAAFSASSERLRIGALLTLRGVNWPMASAMLHFAFPDRYPILDVRAMETVDGSKGYTLRGGANTRGSATRLPSAWASRCGYSTEHCGKPTRQTPASVSR